MRRFLDKTIVLIVVFSLCRIVASANLSGHVNHYDQVIGINGCSLEVDSTNNFDIGDLVLLIQMKGGTMKHDNDSSYGELTEFGSAGLHEVNEVLYVEGNFIYLKHQISKPFEAENCLQVVGFHPSSSATIDQATVRPWNGKKGGVLFVSVPDNITVNGNINANGAGYRGGAYSLPKNGCAIPDYEVDAS